MALQGIHNLHICLNIGVIDKLPLYLLGEPIEKVIPFTKSHATVGAIRFPLVST